MLEAWAWILSAFVQLFGLALMNYGIFSYRDLLIAVFALGMIIKVLSSSGRK